VTEGKATKPVDTKEDEGKDVKCYSCGATFDARKADRSETDDPICPHCDFVNGDDKTGTHAADHRTAYASRHRANPDDLDRFAGQ
jgi:hypothetical protein